MWPKSQKSNLTIKIYFSFYTLCSCCQWFEQTLISEESYMGEPVLGSKDTLFSNSDFWYLFNHACKEFSNIWECHYKHTSENDLYFAEYNSWVIWFLKKLGGKKSLISYFIISPCSYLQNVHPYYKPRTRDKTQFFLKLKQK